MTKSRPVYQLSPRTVVIYHGKSTGRWHYKEKVEQEKFTRIESVLYGAGSTTSGKVQEQQ